MFAEPWHDGYQQDASGKWYMWRSSAIKQQLYAAAYHQALLTNTRMERFKVGVWQEAEMASCNTDAKLAAGFGYVTSDKWYKDTWRQFKEQGADAAITNIVDWRKKIENYKSQIFSIIKSVDSTNRQALHILGKDVDNIKAVRDLSAQTAVGLAAGAGYLGWAAVGILGKNLAKVSDSFIGQATTDEKSKAIGFGVVETAVDLMFLGIAPSAATMTIKEKLIVFGMLKGSLEGAKSMANGDSLGQVALNVAGETLAIGKDVLVDKVADWVVPVVSRLSSVIKASTPEMQKTVAGIVPGVAAEAGMGAAKAEANDRLGQPAAGPSVKGMISLPRNLHIKGLDSDRAYVKTVCIYPSS